MEALTIRALAAALLLLALPTLVPASDWRVHLNICNQDPACAKEQAAARDLWDSQKWTPELKDACRKRYIGPYAKDYTNALKCVTELERQRQEMEKNEAEIDRKRREHKTYRSWGGVIIK